MALSREARALRRSNVVFKRGIDPDTVIAVLYSKFLLTPEEKGRATQKTLTADQQLDIVFDWLERRVSVQPTVFHELVKVLEDEPALEAVGKRMQGQAGAIRCVQLSVRRAKSHHCTRLY